MSSTLWPFWHPVKILGNVSSAAVVIALAVFLWRRIADSTRAGKSTYSDWLFLAILLLTTLTGFFCQWLRLAGLPVAYPMYFVHLLLIFFLLVYIPYSKFAHLVYRTVAMLYSASSARRAERQRRASGILCAAGPGGTGGGERNAYRRIEGGTADAHSREGLSVRAAGGDRAHVGRRSLGLRRLFGR